MTKPILIPLPVPWKVESGYPCLRLEAWEAGSGQPTRVHFNAFIPMDVARFEDGLASGNDNGLEKENDYREIEVSFFGTIAARLLPAYTDSEVISEDAYDWSRIDVDYSIADGVDEFRARFRRAWRRTGHCPNPSAYSIESSDWLPTLAFECSGINHYMICGHDNYAEILAVGYSWVVKGLTNLAD